MAVDQARSGAWSVFDYETKNPVSYGTFTYGNKDFTYARATVEIENLIHSVIEAYHVSAVFLEDIQLRQNVNSFKKLAMLQGVLAASFEKGEYLYAFIAPAKWQNYLGTRGRNEKEKKAAIKEVPDTGKKKSKTLSIQFVKEQFGIETDNDNLSDALCIGWYVCNEIKLTGEKEI